MCGFAGVIDRDGHDVDPAEVAQMLSPLLHRGPDGRGLWSAGSVALGHLRLSILDLSQAAHQPMVTQGETGVLAYNGEVYNYRSLRADLEREGVPFVSTGDTEVVLKALATWGPEQAILRFDGMFALAYFNASERTLWLARDRLGIKPLYVFNDGRRLLFASEPKALLAHPRVPVRPDRLAMAALILRGRPDARTTLYEGIEAIEPGTVWRIHRTRIERNRFFHVLDALDVERLRSGRHDTAPERLEAALDRSVEMHLASDVPLATICSGGVDSSLITALARRYKPDLHSYVADVKFADGEGPTAQRAADHLGVPLTRVPIDRDLYLALWPEAVSFEGHPCFHRSNVALLGLTRRCREDGIKVLINGEGADELFGGYHWHRGAFLGNTLPIRIARAFVPMRFQGMVERRINRGPFRPMLGISGTGSRAAATVDGDGEARRAAIFSKLGSVGSRADRALLGRSLDDLYYSLDTLLRRHDRLAMASSVEMRVPFVENDVIDLGIHLPRKAKYHRGSGKWVVKQVAEKHLPSDIVHAPKKAFPMPVDFDFGSEALLEGGVTADFLRWSASTTQHVLGACRRDSQLRFHLVGLEIWGRMAFNQASSDSLADTLFSLCSAGARARA